MYASGNGKINVNPADFDWFNFEEEPALPYEWTLGAVDSLNHMETPIFVSAKSTAYDQATLKWNDISNETAYLIERYSGTKFDSIGTTNANDTVFIDSGLTGNTLYLYRIVGKNNEGYSYPSVSISVTTLPKPGPYTGTPYPISGKIEAENYDYGDKNSAFFDTDGGNNFGKYRTDDVDIENCYDTNNGFDIGYINNGEWLVYTVDVTDTLTDIQLRVASPSGGGSIKLELDGAEIGRTDIASTGSWSTWKTVTIPYVTLKQGKSKKLKVTFVKGGFNFNWINFKKVLPNSLIQLRSESFQLYPNPANNTLSIKSDTFTYSTIEIYDLEGKSLFSKDAAYQPEVNLELSLPTGPYILLLKEGNQTKTARFSIIE
jgi:hypothetical protein